MKKLLAFLLAMTLIVDGSMAFAGKSYSSGRSSGSSYSGRSYSGGGSSYSGRSYSSGSSSKSGSSSYKPSYSPSTSSSGKSYSSGKSSYTPSKPYTPSYTPSTSSSGKSYSSGSKSSSSKSYSSKPYTPSYTPSSPSGKSYSSDSNSNSGSKSKYSGGSSTNQPPPVGKPASSNFNGGMSQSAKHEESRVRYQAANAPKQTYTPPGSTKPIKTNPTQVQNVRRHVTHERYVTYDNRASVFYGGYYGHPVYYHDPFSPFLWGWIMSDSINSHQRALWMYHHQNDMDEARYQAMLAKDAKLQAELEALKAANMARDPNYVPEQMQDNPDVMYNKEFVEASYNPVAVETVSSSSGAAGVISVLFWTIVILGIGGIFLYFMFVKEY